MLRRARQRWQRTGGALHRLAGVEVGGSGPRPSDEIESVICAEDRLVLSASMYDWRKPVPRDDDLFECLFSPAMRSDTVQAVLVYWSGQTSLRRPLGWR